MYEHAKRINPASRVLDRVNSLDILAVARNECAASLWKSGTAADSGRDIKEGAVVKRDDGEFRLAGTARISCRSPSQSAQSAERASTKPIPIKMY